MMRGDDAVVSKMRGKDPASIKVPEVVRAELIFGCLNSARPTREREKLEYVLAPFEVVPFGGDAVEHYGAIRLELSRGGNMIGPNDLLIAASSRAVGAVMVTANVGEFSRVPGLVVEDWGRG